MNPITVIVEEATPVILEAETPELEEVVTISIPLASTTENTDFSLIFLTSLL